MVDTSPDAPAPADPPLLEQDFVKLEKAIESGVWDVDGDDFNLYVSEEGDEGLPGAVLMTEGNLDDGTQTEFVHEFCDGAGSRISRIVAHLVLEELDNDTGGSFTVGLSYDEDFEESAVLGVILRSARDEEWTMEPTASSSASPLRVCLLLNGEVVLPDIGPLPVRVELDVSLRWETGSRRVTLRHRLHGMPSSAALASAASIAAATAGDAAEAPTGKSEEEPQPSAESTGSEADDAKAPTSDGHGKADAGPIKSSPVSGASADWSPETSADFYTRGNHVKTVKAFCLRSKGTLRVRLLYARCEGPTSGS